MKNKRILVAPLNWGLGHASRCVPIVSALIKVGAIPVLAAENGALALLKQEFPDLESFVFSGKKIHYPNKKNINWFVLKESFTFLFSIYREHQTLKKIVKKHKIDGIISDNRYGLWHKKIPCVLISHQLKIKMPAKLKWLESTAAKSIQYFISKYNACWIPDFEAEKNLAGDLSHLKKMPSNSVYIGILSRFEKKAVQEKKVDLTIILSGPEPQRSILEKKILMQITNLNLKSVVLLRGLPQSKENLKQDGITIFNHLKSEEIEKLILDSKLLISRSGYSSIMEFYALNSKVIFVPTPEQGEQEYLAEKFLKEKIAFYQTQENFDLKKALQQSKNFKGFQNEMPSKQKLEELFSIFLE